MKSYDLHLGVLLILVNVINNVGKKYMDKYAGWITLLVLIGIFLISGHMIYQIYIKPAIDKKNNDDDNNNRHVNKFFIRFPKIIFTIIIISIVYILIGYFWNRNITAKHDSPIKYNSSLIITSKDLNKTYIIDEKENVIIDIPSINKANIGAWIKFVKMNTGYVIIKVADNNRIADQIGADGIQNFTKEIGTSVTLNIIDQTTWNFEPSSPTTWLILNLKKSYFPKN